MKCSPLTTPQTTPDFPPRQVKCTELIAQRSGDGNHSLSASFSGKKGFLELAMPTLSMSRETLVYIIEKAREFDALVPPVLIEDGSNPTDDEEGDASILEDRPDNPTAQELKVALDTLNDDQRDEIVALTWVGRGDFTNED